MNRIFLMGILQASWAASLGRPVIASAPLSHYSWNERAGRELLCLEKRIKVTVLSAWFKRTHSHVQTDNIKPEIVSFLYFTAFCDTCHVLFLFPWVTSLSGVTAVLGRLWHECTRCQQGLHHCHLSRLLSHLSVLPELHVLGLICVWAWRSRFQTQFSLCHICLQSYVMLIYVHKQKTQTESQNPVIKTEFTV